MSFSAGVGGFLLRRQELASVFDPGGLAEKNAPVTLAIIAMIAAVIAISIVCGVMAAKKYSMPEGYFKAFEPLSSAGVIISLIAGLAVIAGAVMFYFDLPAGIPVSPGSLAFIALAAAAGISFAVLAIGAKIKKTGASMCLCGIIPSLFTCLWLIIVYRENNTNPVLLDFYLLCVALYFAALSFY